MSENFVYLFNKFRIKKTNNQSTEFNLLEKLSLEQIY